MTAILRQQHFTQIHTPKAHPSSHTQKHYAAAEPLLHQRHLCFDGRWWMGEKDHFQLTRGCPADLLAAVYVWRQCWERFREVGVRIRQDLCLQDYVVKCCECSGCWGWYTAFKWLIIYHLPLTSKKSVLCRLNEVHRCWASAGLMQMQMLE